MAKESLRNQAYRWLKNKIITLEFSMGSALIESDLCAELDMGRTPVREAVRQLESEGLVTILPRKGTFVSNINLMDFESLLETRIMLETHVARKLASSITAEQVNRIRSLFDDAPALIKQRRIDELLMIDRQFHQGLVLLLDNPYLSGIAENIYDLATRTWYLSFRSRSQEDLLFTVQSHLDILDTLEGGDVEAAEKIARDHVVNFKNKVFHQPQV